MTWRGFARTVLVTTAGLLANVSAALVVIDPYDTVFFSPPFERSAMATNQRFSYPALARRQGFDSAVVGTSTVRLLRPELLNEALGGRFVNLAMNSGTPYEQSLILGLFARHHPEARTVILGIDLHVWCGAEPHKQLTERPFPPWMYDENRWNDLVHLLNPKSLEIAGRQLGYLVGVNETKYGTDGYANFLPPPAAYDIDKVRRSIYGDEGPRAPPPVTPPQSLSIAEREALRFPDLVLLRAMVRAVPEGTRKVLLVPPYHVFRQPPPGSGESLRFEECRYRLVRIAESVGNAQVLDFMIESAITTRDENYWDPHHTTTGVADEIVRQVALALAGGIESPGVFRRLDRAAFAERRVADRGGAP